MVYDSTITFTLDTICPWTYLAKKRLDIALARVRATDPPVNFTVHISPYQLYPDAPTDGQDKYEWYKREKYGDNADAMAKYCALMSAYGVGMGIDFKFGGRIAGTLPAHRVIQATQEARGPPAADALTMALYKLYFEEEQHPSSAETLREACRRAGVDEAVVDDENEGLAETKMAMRQNQSNGVDAVPHVMIEGRRRDFTLEGAKDVDEYVKTLQQVIKEAT